MSSIAVSPSFTVRRPARAASTPVRLTRRGRVVVTVLFLGLLMATLVVFGARSAATGEPGTPVRTHTVQVGEGDTLWEIASRVAAPGQTREMVLKIEELNALSSAALREGQRIAVPVG
ncbi:MAG: LysM peptidoglycan-binding domain-containing protein [Nocardioidaceae bacterium]